MFHDAGTPLSLRSVVAGLSTALDLAFADIAAHHTRVAWIALRLGRSLGMGREGLLDLFLAAALHDLGAIDAPERGELAAFDLAHPQAHCRHGAAFLAESGLLAGVAPVVESHHDDWAGDNPSGLRGEEIPIAARVLHVADRVDVLCHRELPALGQRDAIRWRIQARSGRSFDPRVVEAFADLTAGEPFWREYGGPDMEQRVEELAAGCGDRLLPSDAITPLARMFGRVIDSRSPTTREHSGFVARLAAPLARAVGFDAAQQADLAVAALLHDVGKLGVPEPLLLKAGPLTPEEQEVMKRHAGLTDRVLRRIRGIGDIRPWAAFHHERLDGRGYPWRLDRRSLPIGSQLVSVCDQFAALAGNRPYRAALDLEATGRLLGRAAHDGALNGDLVDLLVEHYREAELPLLTPVPLPLVLDSPPPPIR